MIKDVVLQLNVECIQELRKGLNFKEFDIHYFFQNLKELKT